MQENENNYSQNNQHSPLLNLQQTLDRALQYYLNGELPQAQKIFMEALAAKTDTSQDLHMLGVTAMQMGDNNQAMDLIIEAIRIKPNFAEAHKNLAIVYHALGRLDDSLNSFQDAISANPNFADPYNLLGSILIELGRFADAITYFQQAISLNQNYAFAHYNLGNAYMLLGQYEDAKMSYANALASKPDFSDACYNLGNVYFQLGELEDAIASYQKTIEMNPNYHEAYNNQAIAHKELGRLDEARAVLEILVSINPEYPDAYKNLGDVHMELEQFKDAIDNFKKAILLAPDFAEAYINLGLACEEECHFEEAISSYQIALRINPELNFVNMNLGNAYKKNGDFQSAIASYEMALSINPDLEFVHFNIAVMYSELGDREAAIAAYQAAIASNPNDPGSYTNLGVIQRVLLQLDNSIKSFESALVIDPNYALAHSNLGLSLQLLGRVDEAIDHLKKSLKILPDDPMTHSTLLFTLGWLPEVSGKTILDEARQWDDIHSAKNVFSNYDNIPDLNRKLRVGYVSADFKNHAVAYLLEPLLAEHNRDEVEVFCYAEVKSPDDATARFQKYADHWRSTVGVDDDEMNAMIRHDKIDIIVECTGRSKNNRLLALSSKPAPVQVNYFPMHGQTTGMASMDYVFSDSALNPPGFENQFSEKVVNIEHGAFPFLPNYEWPEVAPPRCSDDEIVFACVGDPARIGEATINLWAQLLEINPDANLLFKHPKYGDHNTLIMWQNKFSRIGERVLFEGVEGGWAQNMDVYGRIDVLLDTIPMSGGTSCAIPLWMGVPVVTMASQYVGHRIAVSILVNSGVPELVAKNDDDYLRIVTELINDRDRLTIFREEIRDKMEAAPICNSLARNKDVEDSFRIMWKSWCASQNGKQ
jgi:protein O-GlcNAc transferase